MTPAHQAEALRVIGAAQADVMEALAPLVTRYGHRVALVALARVGGTMVAMSRAAGDVSSPAAEVLEPLSGCMRSGFAEALARHGVGPEGRA